MEVSGHFVITWWMWAIVATVGILLSICVILKLHELGIYPLREVTKIIRRPWFETLLLLFCVGGLIQYGATKGTNGTENANQPSHLTQRSGLQSGDSSGFGDGRGETFAITNLCFTGIVPLSNSVCLSVAWPTSMFVEGTTLDFFAKVNALTNGWTWLESYATVPFATNLEVEIAYPILASSPNVPAAMFFRVQDRNTCALTMRDSDLDGIPDVYELHNGTNPYVSDSGSVSRLTVGQNGTYASVEAALADSMAYSVIALGGETFVQSKSLVMPSHPVLIEGPDSGYAIIQSDSEIAWPGEFRKAGTLISRRHMVFANHFPAEVNKSVWFVGTDGNVYSNTIVNVKTITGTDIQIALLATDTDEHVNPAIILPKGFVGYMNTGKGLPVLAFDYDEQGIVYEIKADLPITDSQQGERTVSTGIPVSNHRILYHENVVVGDSGNPCFLLFGTNAVFLGAAHTGNHSVARDTYEGSCSPFVTYYAEQIQDAMDALCPGYSLHYLDLNGFECLE